jgi:hypothetical protein
MVEGDALAIRAHEHLGNIACVRLPLRERGEARRGLGFLCDTPQVTFTLRRPRSSIGSQEQKSMRTLLLPATR